MTCSSVVYMFEILNMKLLGLRVFFAFYFILKLWPIGSVHAISVNSKRLDIRVRIILPQFPPRRANPYGDEMKLLAI